MVRTSTENDRRLLDRSLALQVAIGYAQDGKIPPLEAINKWREAMGWHPLGSEQEESDGD